MEHIRGVIGFKIDIDIYLRLFDPEITILDDDEKYEYILDNDDSYIDEKESIKFFSLPHDLCYDVNHIAVLGICLANLPLSRPLQEGESIEVEQCMVTSAIDRVHIWAREKGLDRVDVKLMIIPDNCGCCLEL